MDEILLGRMGVSHNKRMNNIMVNGEIMNAKLRPNHHTLSSIGQIFVGNLIQFRKDTPLLSRKSRIFVAIDSKNKEK